MNKYYFNIKNKLLVIIFISIISAVSCNEIVELDMPESQSSLVINSLFSPDSVFTVFVTKTVDITDTNLNFISDAHCKLFANDSFLFELKYDGEGLYKAPGEYKPLPGIKYKIIVAADGFESIWAEDSIPTYVPALENLEVRDSVMLEQDVDPFYFSELDFDMTDQKANSNYYEIHCKFRDDSVPFISFDSITGRSSADYIKTNDEILANEGLNDFYCDRLPFSDKLFNNKHRFSIFVAPNVYRFDCFTDGLGLSHCKKRIAFYTLFLKIRSTSQNYYNYRRTLILHQYNQTGDFWTGTGNQIEVFSNVHNGYGIFAGFREITDSIKNYSFQIK